ncbi:MAG: hypothetical protein PHQ95_03305 [Candidatus Gracilibacteria bacterium]|nr:hypothetical protein [Candidatus Gracilibacteria bacterium]
MAEGLQEKQPQQTKQIGELKLPQGVLSNPKYQAEKGQVDMKKSAITALAYIPCTSEDVADRDRFIQYIEAHKQATQIYAVINLLPKEELLDCFDATFGTSFADACTPEFIDAFCKKAKQEVTEAKQEVTEAKQEVTEAKQEVTEAEIKKNEDRQKTIDIKKEKENEQKLSVEQKQVLLNIRKKLKSHHELNQKDIDVINNDKILPSSLKFQQATKNILAELKTQAQKSGDFQEYRSFLDNFHSIGAISNQEFLYFKKELDGFKPSSGNEKDGKSGTSETLGKDLRNHEYEKVGDSYIRFGRLGEQTDEIVRIDEKSGEASKRIVSSKSGYAREIVFPKTPALERDVKIGAINEKLSSIENKLTKIAEYKKEQKTLENTPNRTEKEESRLKELKSLNMDPESVMEIKLKEEKVRLEVEKRELPQVDMSSQELQAKQEKDARDTIKFVDDMGLYMLGVENVDTFFQFANSRMMNGDKINSADGLDGVEKDALKKVFIEFLGGTDANSLFSGYGLSEGKTTEDIKKLLITKGIYEVGKVPPIKKMTTEELKIVMNTGKSEVKNTL